MVAVYNALNRSLPMPCPLSELALNDNRDAKGVAWGTRSGSLVALQHSRGHCILRATVQDVC